MIYTIPHVVEALREGLLSKDEAIEAVKAIIAYRYAEDRKEQ